MIEQYQKGATRSQIADWIELEALVSKRRRFSWADLVKGQGIEADQDHGVEPDPLSGELLEEEITNGKLELFVSELGDELQFRSESLGHRYPFEFSTRSGRWMLESKRIEDINVSAPQLTYVACLLMSSIRHKTLRSPGVAHVKKMEECMQRLSWYLAGLIVGGESHWFGYPRPNKATTMRQAITKLLEEIRQGRIRDDDPEWTTGHEHDGGIDIIAWRSFLDGRPGSLVLYGQVASGDNWIIKPVSDEGVKANFHSWFLDEPTSHFLPATFIPFMQHDGCKPKSGQSFETAAYAKALHFEQVYGLIVDRMRLCELAAMSDEIADRIVSDTEVTTWLAKTLEVATS